MKLSLSVSKKIWLSVTVKASGLARESNEDVDILGQAAQEIGKVLEVSRTSH